MPRPQTRSDADILNAAMRAIARVGPAKLTLADVARDVELSPATLVQRFGSKRGLMLALVADGGEAVRLEVEAARKKHGSPLEALLALGKGMAGMGASAEELANHLAFLQLDLTDPEFHAAALEHARAMEAGLRGLVEDAVEQGELSGVADAAALARAVQVTMNGSLITWAIFREGSAAAAMRRDLDALLEPHRKGKRKGR